MHMIDVMTKLKEIVESGYESEDVQRGIEAAAKTQPETTVIETEEEAVEEFVEAAADEVIDEAEVAEEEVEEDAVEEVHEDVDSSLEDILKLAGRSGVMGMNQNNLLSESVYHELDEADLEEARYETDEAEEVEEGDVDMEETVEVPVSALSELMRLAGYETYEAKIDEYENDPEEEYMDAEDQLVGLSGGLNGPKGMYPTAAGGDNAMAVSALKVKEDTLSFESFYKKYQEFVTEEK